MEIQEWLISKEKFQMEHLRTEMDRTSPTELQWQVNLEESQMKTVPWMNFKKNTLSQVHISQTTLQVWSSQGLIGQSKLQINIRNIMDRGHQCPRLSNWNI